ncbi:23S rRNA (uracil(1939)-C(5))-methyltransferase RlmD [Cellvibrio polysaccharolyticus]|uniref:23S rRNA (uracil(1939)-C(5))-methyltransferase RlmD n=1 Tax=Cellvibrio polysaccharolyticus TaxID=2082724 RepID=A0A928V7M4_9GAMM|nr:23S rRNA (uracil(1939)-C(5))-methyltransferase RlmD [Cellvibrio polysaccharolyticus]MBE8718014.1 23S rRNA (uracil(1939)-C(5))-methyltransferase RlmD [Cellvibrio polysaccharolyticus]
MSRGKQGGSNARPGSRFISSSRNSARTKGAGAARSPVNQKLGEFTIERMGHDGRGIANWQGKTLFIDGALQGETVSARLQQDHARYAEAVVENLLVSSAERQTPVCEHYHQCGGCQLQHWQPAHQLAFKQATALEQMKRWGGLEPAEVLPAIVSASEGYRSRARLGVWYENDGTVTLGFRQRQSNKLTPISNCVVLEKSLNSLIAPLQNWLAVEHSARAVTHIELLAGQGETMVILRHTRTPGERDWQGLRLLEENLQCRICVDDGSGVLKDLQGQAIDPRLFYYADEALPPLAWHPQDFTQVNRAVNRQMVAQAIDLLALRGKERVLDLFCGIGNFTLPLAKHCAEVIGVEAVENMVERGRENAQRSGVENVRFIAADLTRLSVRQLQQQCGKIDAVLLDPPRDGAKEILMNIRQLGAKKLVYVSCNPATLARDAAILAEAGYTLARLGVMDMFPHTAHVESMALFVLNKK